MVRYPHAQAELDALALRLAIIGRIAPTNELTERERFLVSSTYNPEFTYPTLKLDLDALEQRLRAVTFPDTSTALRLSEAVEHTYLRIAYLRARGDVARTLVISSELFGTPDPGVNRYARSLLEHIQREEESFSVPSDVLQDDLRAYLRSYGLTQWRVVPHTTWTTTVNHTREVIKVHPERRFTERDRVRLPVHEVGVHILREINHRSQDHAFIHRSGSEHYVSTEEGLAAYAEELNDVLAPNLLREYAARHVAVAHAASGASFRSCYTDLRGADLSPEEAWRTTLRAYRGGCFTRDKAYLEGYRAVKDFAEGGGDLAHLYVGKVALSQVPSIVWLLAKRKITRPRLLPSFLTV